MATATSADKADLGLKVVILWGLLGCSAVALADDDELPDLEFLEYLGSWEGTDEDWLLFEREETDAMAVEGEERNDPAPTGKVSTESDDDS